MTDPSALPLRGIHLPQATGWWPPAPGWWLLSGLVALAVIMLVLLRERRRQRRYSAINMAKEELKEIQRQYDLHPHPRRCVQSISALLRRLCISVFPRMQTASLTGEAWLAFLDGLSEQKPFSATVGQVLISAPYRKQVPSDEVEPLIEGCFEWLDALQHELGKRNP